MTADDIVDIVSVISCGK